MKFQGASEMGEANIFDNRRDKIYNGDALDWRKDL
jgi:hypothetical protein